MPDTTSRPPTIRAAGLTKMYSPGAGVFGLDVEIPPGRILGLIGPSGSGKTTAVRLFTGLTHPNAGTVEVFGQSPASFTTAARNRIGYLSQDPIFYPTLSIAENLEFAASLQGMRKRDRRQAARRILEIVGLSDVADRRLIDSSGGMRRRMGLAAALVHGPDLAFLDEPTAGLDPILRKDLWEEFVRFRDEGTTMVITTQHVSEASSCDEIVLLSEGTVVAQGPPEDVRRHAYGGELLRVRFQDPPSQDDVRVLADALGASDYEGTGIGEVRFTVPDAGPATADLPDLAARRQLTVVEVDRIVPEFDDAFVRIVDRHRAGKRVDA